MTASAAPLRVGILATHPIQYYAPWYRALDRLLDLEVLFSHRQTPEGQARAGFGVEFDWDVPVLDGYRHTFLRNVARRPDVGTFWGCNTPDVGRIVAARRFDAVVVHGWATLSYWQAMTACWRSGTPLIVRGDSTLAMPRPGWWRALKVPAFRLFIPRFDAYLVVGARAREYLTHYGAQDDRCFDAPHAVDNAFFAERADGLREDRAGLRRAFGLPDDGVVLLFAGRLVDMKQPMTFVEAVASLAARHRGVAALVAGDGPLRAALEARVARDALPVRFAGFLNQTEMARAYAAADVLVLPSDSRETWGLVVNEAMACGLPAVVSDRVGCAADLVRTDETGAVFRFGSVPDLTEHLERIVLDAPYRDRLGRLARTHIARWDVSIAAAGTVQAVRFVRARRAGEASRSPGAEVGASQAARGRSSR